MKSCFLTTRRKRIIINTVGLTAALRGKVKVRRCIVHSEQKAKCCLFYILYNQLYLHPTLPPAWLLLCSRESCSALQETSSWVASTLWASSHSAVAATLVWHRNIEKDMNRGCICVKSSSGSTMGLISEGHQGTLPRTTAFCIPCSSLSGHPSATRANRLWNTMTPRETSPIQLAQHEADDSASCDAWKEMGWQKTVAGVPWPEAHWTVPEHSDGDMCVCPLGWWCFHPLSC